MLLFISFFSVCFASHVLFLCVFTTYMFLRLYCGLTPPYMCIRYSTDFLLLKKNVIFVPFRFLFFFHISGTFFFEKPIDVFYILFFVEDFYRGFPFLFGHIPFQHFLDLFYLIFRFCFFSLLFFFTFKPLPCILFCKKKLTLSIFPCFLCAP